MDVDSPLDVLLLARDAACPPELRTIAAEIAAGAPAVVAALEDIRLVLADRRAEVVVAGRTSSRALDRLAQTAACRVRALIEERGLRASSPLALGPLDTDAPHPVDAPGRPGRPPRSVLGMLLDDRGPDAFGAILAALGDGAVVDSRVLLAHRLGADETGWPPLADRLASDLLRPDDITDPWLRALTAAAVAAPVPILLGGHSLVGPGLPLLARG
jgi:hypothetical protein